jgi:hypothetical protein
MEIKINPIQKRFVFGHGDVNKMTLEIQSYLEDILITEDDIVRITITVKEKES